jgi:hypothetical protein
MKWKRHTGDGENQPSGFLPCSFIETVGEEEKTRIEFTETKARGARTGRGEDCLLVSDVL